MNLFCGDDDDGCDDYNDDNDQEEDFSLGDTVCFG